MRIFRGIHHPGLAPACALTIGNFDGVHRGHQAMLALLNNEAAHRDVPSCVLTFEPHPRDHFARLAGRPELAPRRIATLRDKLGELQRCGVQQAVVLRFDQRFAAQSPQAFIDDVLVRGLRDGSLLAPEPVLAHAVFAAPRPKGPPLVWWPLWAGISRSGDLGFTTGPYTSDGKPGGYYFTVWATQPDGSWKWLYDGGPPSDTTRLRSARSFMSITRRQTMRRVSSPSALPWWIWLSTRAASRLCASAMALKSPVKCRLMSSIGSTCA